MNKKGFAPLVLVLAAVVIITLVLLGYSVLRRTPSELQVGNASVYTFKAVADWGSGGPGSRQYPDYFVEVYKNNMLARTVNVSSYTITPPQLFAVSPKQKYVAFKTGGVGGTCVAIEFPLVMDLGDFSVVNIDKSDIEKKLKQAVGGVSRGGINVARAAAGTIFDQLQSYQFVKDVKWISDNEVEAAMSFGGDGCGPREFPQKLNLNIIFPVQE